MWWKEIGFTVFLKNEHAQKSPGEPEKRFLVLTCRGYEKQDWGGSRICISNRFPGDMVHGPHPKEPRIGDLEVAYN